MVCNLSLLLFAPYKRICGVVQYRESEQELQILVPGANVLATIADFDRNGEEMTLISYGFQAPGPCAVWMMVIASGAARQDPTAISSPAPGQTRAPSRPSRASKSSLMAGGMLTLQQGGGTPGVSSAAGARPSWPQIAKVQLEQHAVDSCRRWIRQTRPPSASTVPHLWAGAQGYSRSVSARGTWQTS